MVTVDRALETVGLGLAVGNEHQGVIMEQIRENTQEETASAGGNTWSNGNQRHQENRHSRLGYGHFYDVVVNYVYLMIESNRVLRFRYCPRIRYLTPPP